MQLSKIEPQWLEYFKLVFLEIQNVTIRSVLLNLVTYGKCTNIRCHGNIHVYSWLFRTTKLHNMSPDPTLKFRDKTHNSA